MAKGRIAMTLPPILIAVTISSIAGYFRICSSTIQLNPLLVT
ncbi:hypothetical protein [Sodalis endosymbiont of Henestaris halophilus]